MFWSKYCSVSDLLVGRTRFGSCSDRVADERVDLEAWTVYPGCNRWQRGVERRSPSMLRSWSNMRRSVSSTSTLEVDTPVHRFAGVPICCVGRWKFIRRFAGSPARRFAGVPICCVERWNLIRRWMVIDSPVYADLPVYRSVVLNVGI